jgi:AraC-like DNA-binding protein
VLLARRAATPAEWILELRLAAAKEDLAAGGTSVGVIAHRWGFKDHAHFTHRFKAEYGMTPSEFGRLVGHDSS